MTKGEKLHRLFRKPLNAIFATKEICIFAIQTTLWLLNFCLSPFERGDRLLVSKSAALSMFVLFISHDQKVTKGDKMAKDFNVGS